jgi:ComF family protein
MLDIFLQNSDIIAPPNESIALLRKENIDTFLRHLSPQKIAHTIALSNYNNPIIKASITANKFYNHKKAARLLASLLDCWLHTLPTKPTILVPVPLSKKRQKERGYNQVTRVLENLTNKNFEILPLLIRHKETVPQTSLAREERLKNMIDVFVANHHPKDLAGHRIVIVDDVTTTGATLHSALSALKPNTPQECEIICLALAH